MRFANIVIYNLNLKAILLIYLFKKLLYLSYMLYFFNLSNISNITIK